MNNKLIEARKIINRVDKEMANLFEERMYATKLVAEYKAEHGIPILDKAREETVITENSSYVDDEVIRAYYVNFLKNNMEISKSYQSMLMEGVRVAYCGTEGAFAYIAASKLFPSARKVSFGDFESAYKSVESGECDMVVLPIENSFNGEVGQVSDLMFSGSLFVNSVMDLSVSHNLICMPNASIEDIKRVVSHPQALGQCSKYIREHGFSASEYTNTALAVKHIAELKDKSVAAIGSEEAAEIFGLKVLERNINSTSNNTTRFAVLSRSENKHDSDENDVHTLLLFSVRNEAGALARAIEVIGKHGFNMRALRSRPMKELLWQYYFYVEAEGNVNTSEGQAMMRELSKYCNRLKAIGTYIKHS